MAAKIVFWTFFCSWHHLKIAPHTKLHSCQTPRSRLLQNTSDIWQNKGNQIFILKLRIFCILQRKKNSFSSTKSTFTFKNFQTSVARPIVQLVDRVSINLRLPLKKILSHFAKQYSVSTDCKWNTEMILERWFHQKQDVQLYKGQICEIACSCS